MPGLIGIEDVEILPVMSGGRTKLFGIPKLTLGGGAQTTATNMEWL